MADTAHRGPLMWLALIISATGLLVWWLARGAGIPHAGLPNPADSAANLAKISAFNARVVALTRQSDEAQLPLQQALNTWRQQDSVESRQASQTAAARYERLVSALKAEADKMEAPVLALRGYERALTNSKRELARHFATRAAYARQCREATEDMGTAAADSKLPEPADASRMLSRLQEPYLAMGYDLNDIDTSTMTLKPGTLPIRRLPD